MKEGDAVVVVGLVKAKHLNGKTGVIVEKDGGDRWLVEVLNDDQKKVKVGILLYVCAKGRRCSSFL